VFNYIQGQLKPTASHGPGRPTDATTKTEDDTQVNSANQSLLSFLPRLLRYLPWSNPEPEHNDSDTQQKNLNNITNNLSITQSTIDITKLYYIKNRATGRFWSYVGDGVTGYVVCDRVLHPGAAYFQVRFRSQMLRIFIPWIIFLM
jgi:hypothetical protein